MRIGYPLREEEYPRPAQLDEMLAIAESLSNGIAFIRVDLYNFNSRVIFGEMTLSPGEGYKNIQPPEYDTLWGRELILPH